MGLAKKGTSKIVVNGISYRWVVAPDSGFMDVIFEEISGNGQRVSVGVCYCIGEVTPKWVRKMILLALSHGWEPKKPGKQMSFWFDGQKLS